MKLGIHNVNDGSMRGGANCSEWATLTATTTGLCLGVHDCVLWEVSRGQNTQNMRREGQSRAPALPTHHMGNGQNVNTCSERAAAANAQTSKEARV